MVNVIVDGSKLNIVGLFSGCVVKINLNTFETFFFTPFESIFNLIHLISFPLIISL